MLTKQKIIKTLQTIKDPEVGIDIYTMGLIYNLEISAKGGPASGGKNNVKILMTYTTPFCPWGPQLNEEIRMALKNVGAENVDIHITFDPPYKMPKELKTVMGL